MLSVVQEFILFVGSYIEIPSHIKKLILGFQLEKGKVGNHGISRKYPKELQILSSWYLLTPRENFRKSIKIHDGGSYVLPGFRFVQPCAMSG